MVVYEGEWTNDKMEGKGTHHYPGGGVYVGMFSLLCLSSSFPVVYEGEWMNDKMEGKGTHHYPGGGVYVGMCISLLCLSSSFSPFRWCMRESG